MCAADVESGLFSPVRRQGRRSVQPRRIGSLRRMIQDPSGLLERVPELRPLCEDARVRAAVEGGDPFAVYRALVIGRLTGRLRRHGEAVRSLVRNRRLFAKPMKSGSGPFLGTFNG